MFLSSGEQVHHPFRCRPIDVRPIFIPASKNFAAAWSSEKPPFSKVRLARSLAADLYGSVSAVITLVTLQGRLEATIGAGLSLFNKTLRVISFLSYYKSNNKLQKVSK
jgi:hypothetical protein